MKPLTIRQPIAKWLQQLHDHGLISSKIHQEVLADNERKAEKLVDWSLPHLPLFGPYYSLAEAKNHLPQHLLHELLVVRFIPQNNQPAEIVKYVKIKWSDLDRLVKHLPKPPTSYQITVRQFAKADYLGWLWVNQGKVLIELSPEPNLRGEAKETSSRATCDLNFGPFHLQYDNCTALEKETIWKSLDYFCTNKDRETLLSLKVYSEFMVTKNGNYLFLDVSNHDFWL